MFGIYSCNWTGMNLKFKKLLLLTMRMNSAHRLITKITPTKIINLNFFANVIIENCITFKKRTILKTYFSGNTYVLQCRLSFLKNTKLGIPTINLIFRFRKFKKNWTNNQPQS